MGTTADELKYSNGPTRICGQDEQAGLDVTERSVGGNGLLAQTTLQAVASSGFAPDPASVPDVPTELFTDADSALVCRSRILTDERSYREDFSDTDLCVALTGTVSFTNGSRTVTGVGTDFINELSAYYHIRASTAGNEHWANILSIISSTEILLSFPYTGPTLTGTGYYNKFAYETINGATISNADDSVLKLSSGVTSGADVDVHFTGDYYPLVLDIKASISQRVTTTVASLGLSDGYAQGNISAYFLFDGTDATKVKCITTSSALATDKEITTVSFPLGTDSSTYHRYKIEVNALKTTFLIDNTIVATHVDHIPIAYHPIDPFFDIENIEASSNTILTIDWLTLLNFDNVDVASNTITNPIPTYIQEDIFYITGKLTSSGTTPDQAILKYLVPANKKFYVVGYSVDTDNNGSNLCKLGRDSVTSEPTAPGVTGGNIFKLFRMPAGSTFAENFSYPIKIAQGGSTVKLTVTPTNSSSTNWRATILYVLR